MVHPNKLLEGVLVLCRPWFRFFNSSLFATALSVLTLSLLTVNVPGPIITDVKGFACNSPSALAEYAKAFADNDSRTIGIHRLAGRCTELEQGELYKAERFGDVIQYVSHTTRLMFTLPEFVMD